MVAMACETCRWFVARGGKEYASRWMVDGECRAHPPTALPDGQRAWPLVKKDDWCGAYKAG